ncbi:MAG: GNAT family N-acetyltransferase [Xanthomonadaceae bacterium]|nr:GNAT family N-acetyltransferase [Xanthomonadaceae bacterium]MDE1963215.1 GNAT family N-acetyltransferase [Xanthomonadaceae bacterium]
MKLEPFHIVSGDWSRDGDREAVRQLRRMVLIDGLGLPAAWEFDDGDPLALHLIARDDADCPIGAARLTPDQRISRIAVLPTWQGQGVGTALLRQLVDRARVFGWSEVLLDAPAELVPFYAREGFTPCGELFETAGRMHQPLCRTLQAASAGVREPRDPGLLPADDRQTVDASRRLLLADARHTLAIHLPMLDGDHFASADELAELRRVATSGRGARIRILLHDTGAALRDGHRLVALAQRLSSVIQIRRPVEEVDLANRAGWLLNDTGGYLFLPDHDRPQGRAARHDRAGQAPLVQQFDEMWERSVPATELQALGL